MEFSNDPEQTILDALECLKQKHWWGIRHADGTNEINPATSTKLLAGDVVIVLGHKDDIHELASRFSAQALRMTYRGITIEN